MGCVFARRIPQQVPAEQPETNDRCAERIPILYVPLRSFGCLGAPFPKREYHNLLHFVHKLLHPAFGVQKGCTLFTNRLQTVAHRENLKNSISRSAPARPLQVKGQNTANVLGNTATSKKVESGSRSFALPAGHSTFYKDRASDVGLGRDRSWRSGGHETQKDLGSRQPRWAGDVVCAIPRVRLQAAAMPATVQTDADATAAGSNG